MQIWVDGIKTISNNKNEVKHVEDLVIRECKIKDVDIICELQKQWKSEDITYGFIPEDKEYLISKLSKYFLIAEDKAGIIGFIYGTIHEAKDMSIFTDGERYIEVDDIYVNLEYRNSGVGSNLIDEILDTAGQDGIDRSLIYSSTKDLDNVIKFYKKHGFKTWYVQMFK